MIISAWPLIKVCAQTQDQTNNAYCVILWSFFDKNGQIVSHQFYFFSWRATLVACIQNATDIVNLASRALKINAPIPDQTNKQTDICRQFLTKTATVLATSSISLVGKQHW